MKVAMLDLCVFVLKIPRIRTSGFIDNFYRRLFFTKQLNSLATAFFPVVFAIVLSASFFVPLVPAAPALDCSNAYANPSKLWPVNHSYKKITISGIKHRKDRLPNIEIQCVRQDEPLNANGDGNTNRLYPLNGG